MPTATLRLEMAGIADDLGRLMAPGEGAVPSNRLHYATTFTAFGRTLDEAPSLSDLHLIGTGEPLLCPSLLDMVRMATDKGIHVTVDTNGTLVYRDRAEEMVESGLDVLRVLMDGEDAGGLDGISDGKLRPMDRFGPILENLAGLTAARQVAHDDLRVQVLYLVTERNLDSLPDMVALLGGIWVTNIRILSTLDKMKTLESFQKALITADEYGVNLELSRPRQYTPYLDVNGQERGNHG